MITREEAATYFRNLLREKPSWLKIADSQFVGHLAVFVSWCLREALWRLERLNQEFFISTALNDSSIMAHAEDREYLPRKRIPATGTVTIFNTGAAELAIPAFTEFVSANSHPYLTVEGVTVQAGDSADVPVVQAELKTITNSIDTAPGPYFTYLLELEDSQRLANNLVMTSAVSDTLISLTGITVEIEQPGDDIFSYWEPSRLFQNSTPGSKVYDEFFSHTGQTGIRFGNGLFGMIPSLSSALRITLMLTEGDTELVTGQVIAQVVDLYDNDGNPALFTATVAETIQNGGEREGIAEMKAALHYWPSYHDKLIWNDDYVFFLKRALSGIVWSKVWGEAEEEEISGFSIHNINRIFVTAYAPGNTDLPTEVMARLGEVHLLNRTFTWVDPIFVPFGLTITGLVPRTTNISATEQAIRTVLNRDYGRDSSSRKDLVYLKDIYALVNATGSFSGLTAHFEVEIVGTITPTRLQEMVHVDLDLVEINLDYA